MREKIVPVLIILCVAFTTIAFIGKESKKSVGIDYMRTDFVDLDNILPVNANISFASTNVDSANRISVYLLVRYVLAPRYVAIDDPEYDTTLTYFGTYPTKPEFYAVIGNRKFLWGKRRHNSFFILTSRQ